MGILNWPPGPLKKQPSKDAEKEVAEPTAQERDRALIEQLEVPAQTLLEKIRPHIENGSIGTIIGLDGSGRLPALLIKESLDTLHEQKGFQKTGIKFFAGKVHIKDELIKHPLDKTKKVMLVDDTINDGDSIRKAVEDLYTLGYDVEVLVFYDHNPHPAGTERSMRFPKKDPALMEQVHTTQAALKKEYEARKITEDEYAERSRAATEIILDKVPIHVGIRGGESPIVYRPDLSGVKKNEVTRGVVRGTYANRALNNSNVVFARKVISEVADKVVIGYKSGK